MTAAAQLDTLVRKTITVEAPREVAFKVFTEGMSTWWPLATHKIGKVEAKEAVIQPFKGGRWFERGADGSECDWGRVLAWDPPSRVLLSWEITSDWQHDAGLLTEVEVRFIAEGPNKTRVELEHRNLDRFGAKKDEMREIFSSPGGWGGLLESFRQAAARRS
jgi:uncharacterized protein YndB with AHSA1/START domain